MLDFVKGLELRATKQPEMFFEKGHNVELHKDPLFRFFPQFRICRCEISLIDFTCSFFSDTFERPITSFIPRTCYGHRENIDGAL